VTSKQKRQAAAVAGLALLVWWLWPPEETVTASFTPIGPDTLTAEELAALQTEM